MYFSLMNLFLSNVSGWLLWIVSALLHSLFMLGQRERVRGLVEMVPENPNEMWHIYCPLTFFFFPKQEPDQVQVTKCGDVHCSQRNNAPHMITDRNM